MGRREGQTTLTGNKNEVSSNRRDISLKEPNTSLHSGIYNKARTIPVMRPKAQTQFNMPTKFKKPGNKARRISELLARAKINNKRDRLFVYYSHSMVADFYLPDHQMVLNIHKKIPDDKMIRWLGRKGIAVTRLKTNDYMEILQMLWERKEIVRKRYIR